MEWQKLGSLAELESYPKDSGIYMIIFKGEPRRIIEVGTAFRAGGIQKRFREKKSAWEGGQYTIFGASSNDDVYKFMTLASYQTRISYERFVVELCKLGYLWVPNTPQCPDSLWNWEKWYKTVQLFEVYCWPMASGEERKGVVLESRLQIALGSSYRIGYHTSTLIGDQRENWLGQQGGRKALREHTIESQVELPQFDVRNLDLEEETAQVFNEEKNRELLNMYFEHVDDESCPF